MARSESVRSRRPATPVRCWVVTSLVLAAAGAEAWASQDPSEEIYDINALTTYRLTMPAASWNNIVNDPTGAGDQWQRADMTWTKGNVTDTVPGVGVKSSGASSRAKRSIRISFNEFEFANPAGAGSPGRRWRGVNRLKIDAMTGNLDTSLMRDRIGYWTYREAGAPASRCCHCRLYVNGIYKGVFTLEEPIRKDAVRYLWGNDDGNLYQMSGGWGREPVPYNWRGNDPAQYLYDAATHPIGPFFPESNYPGGDHGVVVQLCNAVNNFQPGQVPGQLQGIINYDRFIAHLAAQAAICDADGIPQTLFQPSVNNHKWYRRSDTGRMEILKYDPGASFGMYDDRADNWSAGFPRARVPIFNAFDSIPLTAWIQGNSAASDLYKAKIRQILDGPWTRVNAEIDFIYNQIRDAAYTDPYKGQTDSTPAITNAEWEAAVRDLKDWIADRTAYLRTQVGASTLPTVTIAATDPNAAEPSSVGVFTVTRTGPTTSTLTVQRQRSGTAVSPDDYNPLPSPFVIPAGSASVTITVTPVDDTAVEGSETLTVTLSADPAYTVGGASSATVTIADNDTAPPPTLPTVTITATDPNASEPADTGTFTVTRTGPTTASLSVYRTRTGTATNTVDFNQLPNPMVIPAGQASVTVTLTPIDDTAVEGAETVILTLDANAAYTVGAASSATATIADNDGATPPTLPTVTLTATDPNAAEPSNVGVFTVTRTGPTTSPLTVQRVRSGTAVSPDDYTPLPSPFVIPAGQATVTITVTPVNDTAAEGNETMIVTLSPDPAYTVGSASSATVTIADDDTGGGGLSGTYYDNEDFTGTSVTRTDATIDFNWADQAPAPGIGPDTFSIRWTGRVRAEYTETYTFYTFTNDGIRLWVEGELLVDKWVQQSGGIEWSAQIALEAGRWYTIQMDHYEGVGNAVARLSWSSPSVPKQVILQSALDPALGAPDSRDNDGDGVPNDSDLDDDNDGIPDLQDSDRDGDTLTNLAEVVSGSDPDDRTSPNAGGVPAVSDGDNDNGGGPFQINDKCGGSIGTAPLRTGAVLLVAFVFLLALAGGRQTR